MKNVFIFLLMMIAGNFTLAQSLKRIIEKGDVEKFKSYIEKGENLDEYILFEAGKHTYNDKDLSIHPMVYAANLNQLEIVKLCIENKDKIEDFHNVMSKAFVSSLHTENDELISFLYELKPNVNEYCGTCYGRNGLMIAASYGLEKWYFKIKPKSDLNVKDELGYTLLHLSALSLNITILNDVLTINDIDINAKSNLGKSALNIAAVDSSDIIYFALLKKGAIIDNKDIFFSDIAIGGNTKIFEDFIKTNPKPNLWQKYKFLDLEDEEDDNYPLENAILSNNNTIAFWIIDHMISELKSDESQQNKEILYNILHGVDYNGDDYYVSVTDAIENSNKVLFEKLIKTCIWFNDQNFTVIFNEGEDEFDVDLDIYFSKFDYKDAKKMFGEAYVEEFYNSLNIEL